MKRPLLTTIGLTAFISVAAVLLISLDRSNKAWREKTQTESTYAKITSIDAAFHNTAYFDYTVNGKTYHSGSSGWGGKVSPGDTIVLHYNPNNATQATLGNFGPLAPWSFAVAVMIISFAVLWSYYLIFIRPKLLSSKSVHLSN